MGEEEVAGTRSGGGWCRGLLLLTAERISLASFWQIPEVFQCFQVPGSSNEGSC